MHNGGNLSIVIGDLVNLDGETNYCATERRDPKTVVTKLNTVVDDSERYSRARIYILRSDQKD